MRPSHTATCALPTARIPSLAKLLCALAAVLALQACKSNFETDVDLTTAAVPTEDAPYVAPGFQDKVLIGALDVAAPKKGDHITLRAKQTTYIYGSSYDSWTKNTYTLDEDAEPLFVTALSQVFEQSPGSDWQAHVVPKYRFKPEQDSNFWHDYVVLSAHLDLHVLVEGGGRVLYDRHVGAGAQEEYSLLVQLYPSGDMINRLMQEALRKAILRLSEDENFLALTKVGAI